MGLSRYITCRIGASKPVSSLLVTITNFRGSTGSRNRSSSFSSASLSRTCSFHWGGSPWEALMTMALARVLLPLGRVTLGGADDNGTGLRTGQLVHHLLVKHTAFPVEYHRSEEHTSELQSPMYLV